MRSFVVVLIASLFASTACGNKNIETPNSGRSSEDALPAYSNAALAGKIGGREWTFKAGIFKENSFHPGQYDLHFYGVEIKEPCDSFNRPWSADEIMDLNMDLKLGEKDHSNHPANQITTMTIVDGTTPNGPHNYATDRAKYTIDAIDEAAATVTGKMVIMYDDKNAVNGTFSATLCKTKN